MTTIANNTIRDSPFGMVARVFLGAFLSITDEATDLVVILNYYKDLVAQANALLIMVSLSMFCQFFVAMGTYAR